MKVYQPLAPEAGRRVPPARRLPSLAGKRVGLLGNLKPNCDVLLRTTEGILVSRYGVSETVYREKSSCSTGAPAGLLDELASTCEAAVVALGD